MGDDCDALLARNAELERDVERLSQGAGSPGIVSYIAEKQQSEREANTYIHELQAKNTALRAELDNLREKLEAKNADDK